METKLIILAVLIVLTLVIGGYLEMQDIGHASAPASGGNNYPQTTISVSAGGSIGSGSTAATTSTGTGAPTTSVAATTTASSSVWG